MGDLREVANKLDALSARFDSFVRRDDDVSGYVRSLEAALGKPEFDRVFVELEGNKRIGQAEAVNIATQFAGYTSPGTSRSSSMRRIRERHEKLMKFKRHVSSERSAS